jgi:hypothetical protein
MCVADKPFCPLCICLWWYAVGTFESSGSLADAFGVTHSSGTLDCLDFVRSLANAISQFGMERQIGDADASERRDNQ